MHKSPFTGKRYIWLPVVLGLYGGLMLAYFGPQLLQEGRHVKFWIAVVVEVVLVVGLFFALRRKARLKEQWKDRERP